MTKFMILVFFVELLEYMLDGSKVTLLASMADHGATKTRILMCSR